jgi:archaemetzincin
MICLVPIGEIETRVLEALKGPLAAGLSEAVEIGGKLDLPEGLWNAHRCQYVAEKIVSLVPLPPLGNRNLGVSDRDIYSPGLNFVFGEAEIGGRRGLISIYRLRQAFYGLPEDAELLNLRTLKEAVHEIGHTHRLKHCSDPRCVMHLSSTLRDTDFKSAEFCPKCGPLLTNVLRQK